MRISRLTALGAAAVVAAAGSFALAPTAQAAEQGTVTVVHGIPGLDVDVYVNDKKTLTDFTAGTVTDPLTLDAGTYSIDIYATGTGPADNPATPAAAAISDTVELPSGANASLVAYLTPDGKPSPKLAVFVNDVSKVKAGEARVTIRHVAAAPAVKVTADGATLIPTLSNPDGASADVAAKTYAVAVSPAAGGAAVFSTDLALPEGTSTIVYAYGDLGASPATFAVATQSISGLAAAPAGVPAGEGPAGTSTDGIPSWLVAVVVAALFGAAFSGRRLMIGSSAG
jgi:hypothetical protein